MKVDILTRTSLHIRFSPSSQATGACVEARCPGCTLDRVVESRPTLIFIKKGSRI